jgi:hypothetical protein
MSPMTIVWRGVGLLLLLLLLVVLVHVHHGSGNDSIRHRHLICTLLEIFVSFEWASRDVLGGDVRVGRVELLLLLVGVLLMLMRGWGLGGLRWGEERG